MTIFFYWDFGVFVLLAIYAVVHAAPHVIADGPQSWRLDATLYFCKMIQVTLAPTPNAQNPTPSLTQAPTLAPTPTPTPNRACPPCPSSSSSCLSCATPSPTPTLTLTPEP